MFQHDLILIKISHTFIFASAGDVYQHNRSKCCLTLTLHRNTDAC